MRSPVEENIQINHCKIPSGSTTHLEMFFLGKQSAHSGNIKLGTIVNACGTSTCDAEAGG